MARRDSEVIGTDWVDWWKPSETQVEWQAAFVEYKRKQLEQQAQSGGYGHLVGCLVPPACEYDVDILDPNPTAEEVEAMRQAAAGQVEPLPIPDGDWSIFEDDDDDGDIEFLQRLDNLFPMGWNWVYWLDSASSGGNEFFAELGKEFPEAEEFFLYTDDDEG